MGHPGGLDRAVAAGEALTRSGPGRLPRFLRPPRRSMCSAGPASSAITRDLLDWQPTCPGIIDDLEKGHYFTGRG
jgi:hypothetical protein